MSYFYYLKIIREKVQIISTRSHEKNKKYILRGDEVMRCCSNEKLVIHNKIFMNSRKQAERAHAR